jgi:methyltransferase (TIGR00027 family)
VIDDALRAFVASAAQRARGPVQVVLLGAGYDTRALRLPELAAARVFEVDHPATQARKRAVLDRLGARSPAHYLSWNFERVPMAELPAALAAAGHDRQLPTFTIWEGVTMYLTEPAIDASLRAIHAWSAPGSELAMTYFTRSRLAEPSLATRAVQQVVARFGEPWRFGWAPEELPAYLAARGFALRADRTVAEAAHELLPARFARWVGASDRRVALAQAQESIALSDRAPVGPGST